MTATRSSATRLGAAGAAAALAAALFGCGRQPNVVLITIDSLRPDHLSAYGYSRRTSPNIDSLAEEGVRFETAISTTSWTLPSHAALFTGLPDWVHGCIDEHHRLREDWPTLAEAFRKAGYRTAAYVSGPYLHPTFGLDRGFDVYGSCITGLGDADWRTSRIDNAALEAWNASSHSDVTSHRVLSKAKSFLEQNRSRPFFLFLHWWDPHYDYEPPPPYDRLFDPDYSGTITGRGLEKDPTINKDMPERDREHLVALYDGEIAWTDHHLGLLFDEMKRLGLWENTIVALTADHGEEFFEHGGKGHQKTLFDEVLKIPLVLRWPGGPRNRVVGGQVRLIDVHATVCDLAGVALPGSRFSRTLVPFTAPGAPLPELPAHAELTVRRRQAEAGCLRVETASEAWKAIRDFATDTEWFYDLRRDPRETEGSMADPRATEAIRRLVQDHGDLSRLSRGPSDVDRIPVEVLQRLTAHGYLTSGQPADSPAPQAPEGSVQPAAEKEERR